MDSPAPDPIDGRIRVRVSWGVIYDSGSTMSDSRARTSAIPASYTIDELAVWRTKLPKARYAAVPPTNSRPNPAVTDKFVFVSVFSPGAICALDRETGKLLWRRELGRFCGESIYLHENGLFAQNSNTLFRLSCETGRPIWAFSPQGMVGETMYSAPVMYRGRVFIGDRSGFLNCVDGASGKLMWRELTNDSDADVNSTPIVVKGLVIAATNARTAVAYTLDGKLKWRTELDGPSARGVLEYHGMAAVAADSLYLLNIITGRIRKRFHWKGDEVSRVDCTPREVVVQLRGCWPPTGGSNVMVLNGSHVICQFYRPGYCLTFRYAKETGLMYESHLEGINAFRVRSGETLFAIRLNDSRGVGLVEVKDRTIYAATGDGWTYALRHPASK